MYRANETRFSLLMGVAFLALSFGYWIILPKYISPNDALDRTGDIMRVCGLIFLFLAVLLPDVQFRKKELARSNYLPNR
jgi:predicted transporter